MKHSTKYSYRPGGCEREAKRISREATIGAAAFTLILALAGVFFYFANLWRQR